MEYDAWEIATLGEKQRGLRLATRTIGEPAAGEALVAIRATSFNYRDLLQLDGIYNPKQRLPLIPCSDAAGDVVAVGPGVTAVTVGDRVVNHGLPGWSDGPYRTEKTRVMYGGPDDGTLATYRCFPAASLVKAPDHLDYVEACTLGCAGLTAWGAVVTTGVAGPGTSIVVQGSGGVSLFALQFAKMTGACVIATSSSDSKRERLRSLGADHTISYLDDGWPQAVRALTDGRGADAIVEVAGTIDQSVRAARGGGAVLSIGVLAGAHPSVDLPRIVMRAIRLQGVTLGSLAEMQRMCDAVAAAKLRPVVDRVFHLDEVPAAFEYYRSASMFGKVVIAMSDP